MMAQQLWAVANATSEDAQLTTTNKQKKDEGPIPHMVVTHTGGNDDDFITIPACSDSNHFGANHITIKAATWTVSFWNNDLDGHKLQWSPSEDYYGGNTVETSDLWNNVAILIEVSNGQPVVHCSQWT